MPKGVFGRTDAVVSTTAVTGAASPTDFAGAVAPADLAGTDVPAVGRNSRLLLRCIPRPMVIGGSLSHPS